MPPRLRTLATTALVAVALLAALAGAERPILILISLDGFRWDYLDRFAPPTLSALAARGVRAEALIPVFPPKTFPNHYTMVTGLYPNRHGIVSNTMADPALPGRFSLSNADVQQDTRWWGGVPLWVTVEQQGQVAATMFWPGSDVEIAGDRPTYWRRYDGAVSNADRVDQLVAWLKEPDPNKPTFLTLYLSDVDDAGHDDGPDSQATRDAVLRVDAAVARLMGAINAAGLGPRTSVVILSDHGMAPHTTDRVIILDDYIDISALTITDWSPLLVVDPPDERVNEVYWALKDKHPHMEIYKTADIPPRLRLAGHPRLGAIVGIADDGWRITSREMIAKGHHPGGDHGYDPQHRSMHGLFIAVGPAFQTGVRVPAFENVHLYEMLCKVLGVSPVSNDGDPSVTARFLASPSKN